LKSYRHVESTAEDVQVQT